MRIVLTTCPINKSKRMIDEVLKSRLAACANEIKLLRSRFWWKRKIDEERESLIMFKTRKELVQKLFKKIREIHPYEVPEIVELKVGKVDNKYLKWLKNVTRGP